MYMYVCMYVHVCMYVCMYVCTVYVCMYACMSFCNGFTIEMYGFTQVYVPKLEKYVCWQLTGT